jgi:hypothetical protein
LDLFQCLVVHPGSVALGRRGRLRRALYDYVG